jgi:Zn-dependent protease
MRDPMSWAIPVFRLFGIQVRVHVFFFVVTLGLFLRQITLPQYAHVWWLDVFLLTVVVLFGSVLLHEFGHCWGARRVGGDAREVLIWPLGGLAFTEIPHNPRALFVTVAAGPAVNVIICIGCGAAILGGGFYPSVNPALDPYGFNLTGVRTERPSTPVTGARYYKPGSSEPLSWKEMAVARFEYESKTKSEFPKPTDTAEYDKALASLGLERSPVLPTWVVWAQRVFWMNWIMFLFNLLPAYPLDGGKLLQSFIWSRSDDYRRGVTIAAYTGFVVAILFLVVSIASNESLFMALSLFMLYECSRALMQLETEEGPFGYDFSAGYTSLEKDDEPPPQPKRKGWFARRREARAARRAAAEAEERRAEAQRVDELLEKIARSGKASLTDEEQRFLERVSARRRNGP